MTRVAAAPTPRAKRRGPPGVPRTRPECLPQTSGSRVKGALREEARGPTLLPRVDGGTASKCRVRRRWADRLESEPQSLGLTSSRTAAQALNQPAFVRRLAYADLFPDHKNACNTRSTARNAVRGAERTRIDTP